MMERHTPGVYFEVTPAEPETQPIPTATVGFVGYAPALKQDGELLYGAPENKPQLVTNWSSFCESFGDSDGNPYLPGCYLAHAVRGFFENGGTRAYVVRAPLPRNFLSALEKDELALSTADVMDLVGLPETGGPIERHRGMGCLAGQDEICMIAIPDLMAGMFKRGPLRPTPGGRCPYCYGPLTGPVLRCYACRRQGREVVREVERDERDEAIQIAQAAMVDYCDQTSRDQIALLDPLPGRGPLATRQWLAGAGLHCERGNAAYYYPWVEVRDARTGEDRIVPPSGHIAGVWARNDAERGVHHSPANLTITGALNVELPLGEQEQATLNREGINCIRAFPGRGIKVWGARTLARDAGEWQYLSVRRLMTYIERLVERQMDWAVFEPNDPLLWERITRYLGALLTVMWREGRLAGSSPDQAFRVKCDAELNTDATVRLGQIITDIRVAPLKPAEFISFRVLQWHGSGSRT